MSIVLDAASTTEQASVGSATFTWAHTVAAGRNILLVCPNLRHTGTNSISGVTYNGVALTVVPNTTIDNGFAFLSWWYLVSPDVGTHNIVVTYTTAPDAGRKFCGTGISGSGAKLTSTVSNGTTTTGQLSSTTLTVSSAVGDLVLAACFVGPTDPANKPISPSAGQTQISAFNTGNSGSYDFRSATSSKAGAASVANSWTSGATTDGVFSGFSLAAASATAKSSVPAVIG